MDNVNQESFNGRNKGTEGSKTSSYYQNIEDKEDKENNSYFKIHQGDSSMKGGNVIQHSRENTSDYGTVNRDDNSSNFQTTGSRGDVGEREMDPNDVEGGQESRNPNRSDEGAERNHQYENLERE